MTSNRWAAARTRIVAILAFAAIVVLLAGLADHSRLRAGDDNDRVLRPMGPANHLLWPDESPIRVTDDDGEEAGKDAVSRDGGGGRADRGGKPVAPKCDCEPTGDAR